MSDPNEWFRNKMDKTFGGLDEAVQQRSERQREQDAQREAEQFQREQAERREAEAHAEARPARESDASRRFREASELREAAARHAEEKELRKQLDRLAGAAYVTAAHTDMNDAFAKAYATAVMALQHQGFDRAEALQIVCARGLPAQVNI